jgi:hypothetical protein
LLFKKCGISNALDGSKDNLFQNEGDDDPFEGFDEEDVRMDEEILANVSSFNEQNTEISDGENEINSELEEENESDYDSDGHLWFSPQVQKIAIHHTFLIGLFHETSAGCNFDVHPP